MKLNIDVSSIQKTYSHRNITHRITNSPAVYLKELRLLGYAMLAYNRWPHVLVVRFTGKTEYLKVRQTKLIIKVARENLSSALWLAVYLNKLPHTQYGNSIRFYASKQFHIDFSADKVLVDTSALRWLGWFAGVFDAGGEFSWFEDHLIVTVDGLKWVVRLGSEDLRLGPLLGHGFEAYEYQKWFKRVIKPNSVFVDIGANVGGYAIRAAALGATVHAFEPSFATYRVLTQNAEINHLVVMAYNLAAGSKAGFGVLYGKKGHEGKFSLVKEPGSEALEKTRILPLDTVLLGRVNTVNLLKMDVEGWEWEALQGCTKLLSKVENIIIEVRDLRIVNWLEKQGFTLLDCHPVARNLLNLFLSKT
ncbi:MAG: FkbM family methyltransferase [Thermoprotei archaeon]